MKEFKGSKGPWSSHSDEESMATSVVMNEFGDILCAVGTYMTSTEEDYANANLIAAAPDLLEALKTARQALEVGKNVAFSDWLEAIRLSDEAISKALGEE